MEKRATVIDSVKEADKNIILVDAGDVFSPGLNPRRHKYIVEAYEYLKYDFWTPGDQDFIEGQKTFTQMLMPVFKNTLNTNFLIDNEKFGQPYVIKEIDGIKIGFTATITQEVEKYVSPIRKMNAKILDQYETLEPVISELKDKCDIIILVSHSGYDNDVLFAEKLTDVDLIIGGHSQTLLKKPSHIFGTYIVHTGKAGYRVGVLKLKIENSEITNTENSLILLDKKIKNHPEIMKIINEYKNNVKY